MNTNLKHRSILISLFRLRTLFLLVTLIVVSVSAKADGGKVALHQDAGPIVVTVFTASQSLRAGPVDLTVLVQDRSNGQPVLDDEVLIQLRKDGQTTVAQHATHDAAQNKLLYSALVFLPEAGLWEFEATIKHAKESERVFGELVVAPPRPFVLSYWRPLSVPPLFVSLFVFNQWLKKRAANRRKTTLHGYGISG